MAYKKKGNKAGYRRQGARRGKVYGAAAGQLWKDVKFLKDLVNAEKKYYDLSTTGAASSSGVVQWLSGLAQGAAGNQRLGNSIKCHALTFRFQAAINAATTGGAFIRCMIFIDRETRGTTPAVTDVLAQSITVSPLNMSNTKRFHILYDNIRALDQNGVQTINVKKHFIYKGHVKWDTTGSSVIANAEEGQIFCLILSDQATNTVPYTLYSRLRFYDN